MTILGTASYIIEHRPNKGCAPISTYVDNFENLRHVIATTWSKVPHRVAVNNMSVQVRSEPDDKLLADFEFKPVLSNKLPDHL